MATVRRAKKEEAQRRHKNKPDNGAKPNILIVEDDEAIVMFLRSHLKDLGYNIDVVSNGREAMELLKDGRQDIDVVVMDWAMPVMDGLTAVQHMRNDPALRHIPVVMLTGADKPEQMKRGLEAGVFYYLTKPVKKSVFHSVLSSALHTARQNRMLAQELGQHQLSFSLMESAQFRFHTLEDAESLAVFMANYFPEPERALLGIGELLINALEHGTLGLGYERKTKLVKDGTWRNEIQRLQALPENAKKSVSATIARKSDGIYMVIEDQGRGFDWKNFMHIEPENAGKKHGRGIAQAKAVSFDKLAFNEKGNRAVAFVRCGKRLEW